MRALVVVLALLCAGCGSVPGVPQSATPASTGEPLLLVDRSSGVGDVTSHPSPAVARRARRAAERFLVAYLRYTYGHGSILAGVAEPGVVAALTATPPDVPPAIAARRPRVRAIRLQWDGPGEATAVGTIDDGVQHYPVVVVLRSRRGGGFIVTELRP